MRVSPRTKDRCSLTHPVWPEHESLFTNPFEATGRTLLRHAPTPQDVLDIDAEELADMIRVSSHGKFGPIKAQQIHHAAEQSVGMQRGLEAIGMGISCLLDQFEALESIRQQLEENIASLYGEIDPIGTFKEPSQPVAFAGLDATVFQTGQYDNPRRHISKRGSPFLRRTLWQMAYRAVYQEGDLRECGSKRKPRTNITWSP